MPAQPRRVAGGGVAFYGSRCAKDCIGGRHAKIPLTGSHVNAAAGQLSCKAAVGLLPWALICQRVMNALLQPAA